MVAIAGGLLASAPSSAMAGAPSPGLSAVPGGALPVLPPALVMTLPAPAPCACLGEGAVSHVTLRLASGVGVSSGP